MDRATATEMAAQAMIVAGGKFAATRKIRTISKPKMSIS